MLPLPRRNRWIGSARRKSTPGSVPGDPISAELRWSPREVSSYARRTSDRARQKGFRRADSAKRQTAATMVFACKISSMGVVSVLSRQVPAILSLARRPGRPDVLLLRVSADNGDTVSGVTLLVIQHPRKPFGCEGMRTVLAAAEEDRAHDTKERERWPRCRRPSDWSPDIVVHYGVGDGM